MPADNMVMEYGQQHKERELPLSPTGETHYHKLLQKRAYTVIHL
jgi:hypothetical protein